MLYNFCVKLDLKIHYLICQICQVGLLTGLYVLIVNGLIVNKNGQNPLTLDSAHIVFLVSIVSYLFLMMVYLIMGGRMTTYF